jgi:hypothetical protein
VFIDGNHNYEPVMADLRVWTPHMKKGGLVCGDDWEIDSVREAVGDFVNKRPGLTLELPCVNTWAFHI